MAMDSSRVSSVQSLFHPILILCAVWFLTHRFIGRHRLRVFPGPLLARATNLWRYMDVRSGSHQHTLIRLHAQHGPIVRIGPNTLSISSPEAIPQIYGASKGFAKSAFYDAFAQHSGGKIIPALFTEKNEEQHQQIRRPVAQVYLMGAMLAYEPVIDGVVQTMIKLLAEKYGSHNRRNYTICNIGEWLQYFAFDTTTEITFSKSCGLLQHGQDVGDYIKKLDDGVDAAAPLSQLPWLQHLKSKNPLNRFLAKDSGFIVSFIDEQIRQREVALKDRTCNRSLHPDLLHHFLAAGKSYPMVDDALVRSYAISNVASGSDALSIPLRAIIFFVLSHEEVHKKLIQEFRSARLQTPVSFQETTKLPYLDAVVKESLRLHPPVGLGLERIVPSSGLQLKDKPFIPPGTQVSICAWVVHRDRHVFGSDADDFNPERWLRRESEDWQAYEKRLGQMKRCTFTFGHGPRACIGKNPSLLIIYKVIPVLFLEFDLRLKSKDLFTKNSWFVRQWGLMVDMRKLKT
ncbi:cytochrome P450 [Trichoderma camerunense]